MSQLKPTKMYQTLNDKYFDTYEAARIEHAEEGLDPKEIQEFDYHGRTFDEGYLAGSQWRAGDILESAKSLAFRIHHASEGTEVITIKDLEAICKGEK